MSETEILRIESVSSKLEGWNRDYVDACQYRKMKMRIPDLSLAGRKTEV
jgi:hypothetical protein